MKLGHLKGEWGFKSKKPRKNLLHPKEPPKKQLTAPCALALWVNTHMNTESFKVLCSRWGLTNNRFRDFVNGFADIPALKLYRISQDTGIPMETLCQEHMDIALSGKRPLEEKK